MYGTIILQFKSRIYQHCWEHQRKGQIDWFYMPHLNSRAGMVWHQCFLNSLTVPPLKSNIIYPVSSLVLPKPFHCLPLFVSFGVVDCSAIFCFSHTGILLPEIQISHPEKQVMFWTQTTRGGFICTSLHLSLCFKT